MLTSAELRDLEKDAAVRQQRRQVHQDLIAKIGEAYQAKGLPLGVEVEKFAWGVAWRIYTEACMDDRFGDHYGLYERALVRFVADETHLLLVSHGWNWNRSSFEGMNDAAYSSARGQVIDAIVARGSEYFKINGAMLDPVDPSQNFRASLRPYI